MVENGNKLSLKEVFPEIVSQGKTLAAVLEQIKSLNTKIDCWISGHVEEHKQIDARFLEAKNIRDQLWNADQQRRGMVTIGGALWIAFLAFGSAAVGGLIAKLI